MPSDTPRKALLDCLLTSHPHQRIRMMMASFASLVMMCCAALMNLLAQAGIMRTDWTLWWTLATSAGWASVLVLIRSGYSQRLMKAVMAHPGLQGLRRFMLATSTAHDLYARYGFTAPLRPETLMERYVPGIYQR